VGWLDEAVVDLEVESRPKDLTALLPAEIRSRVRHAVGRLMAWHIAGADICTRLTCRRKNSAEHAADVWEVIVAAAAAARAVVIWELLRNYIIHLAS